MKRGRMTKKLPLGGHESMSCLPVSFFDVEQCYEYRTTQKISSFHRPISSTQVRDKYELCYGSRIGVFIVCWIRGSEKKVDSPNT